MRNKLGSEGARTLGARLALRTAAVAAAAVLLGLGAMLLAGPAQAQQAGATYSGSFQAEDAGCGGGTITVTLNDDSAIVNTFVTGAVFGGVPIDDLDIDIDPPIELADDGSFSSTFDAVPGIPVTFSGTFDGDSVSGTVDVPALSCAASFTATAGDGTEDPPDDSMDEMPDDSTDTTTETEMQLPSTGGGFESQATIWLTIAGALAAVGIAGFGAAVARKETN